MSKEKAWKNVLVCYTNKDPSDSLPEVGGLRLSENKVEFTVDNKENAGELKCVKEWPWDEIKKFWASVPEEKGGFDKFTMEVAVEGDDDAVDTFEFEAECCDHFEIAFKNRSWDEKKYRLQATEEVEAICKKAFDVMDLDGGGEIEDVEMKRMCKLLGSRFTQKCKNLNELTLNAKETPVSFTAFMYCKD